MTVQLNICLPDGDEKLITVCQRKDELRRITVSKLMDQINNQLKTGKNIRLVFGGETLSENRTLADCGIQHLSTIQTLLILHGGLMM